MSAKVFQVTDPSPWIDQFIDTIVTMASRCGGSSSEFVLRHMLHGVNDPNHLILAATDDGAPDKLVGWMLGVFVPDSHKPWVEIWGMWAAPGRYKDLHGPANEIVEEWARSKGAVRLVAILTRAPNAYLRRFFAPMGFHKTGIVIERRF